jgi:hypothetical protein
MDFIHAREYLQQGDIVVVNSSHQCNVVLTTDSEFANYRSGRSFHHYGGHYKMFPARIAVPHSDNWNITLDLGGGSANIRYSISYVKQSQPAFAG